MNYFIKKIDWRQKRLKPAMLERDPGRELWQPAINVFNIRITRKGHDAPYETHAPGTPTARFMNITDAMIHAETSHNLKVHDFMDKVLEKADG